MSTTDHDRAEAQWLKYELDLYSREPSEIMRILTRAAEPSGFLPVRQVLPDKIAPAQRQRRGSGTATDVRREYQDTRQRYDEARKAARVGRRRAHTPVSAEIREAFVRELRKRGFKKARELAEADGTEAVDFLRAETGRRLNLTPATVRDRVAEAGKLHGLRIRVQVLRGRFLAWIDAYAPDKLDKVHALLRVLDNLKRRWPSPPIAGLYDQVAPALWLLRDLVARRGPWSEMLILSFPGPGSITLESIKAGRQPRSVTVTGPDLPTPALVDAAEAAIRRLPCSRSASE
jgi:hypothetical protein